MKFTERSNSTRWFIIISSFLIVLLILWNTYNFFQIFKNEERNKMELWANAQKTLVSTDENDYLNLILFVQQNNTTIPIILTNENGEISNVIARIVTDKKPKVAIHGLSIYSAISVDIYEPDVIPSDNSNPNDYLIIRKGYCEALALETEGTFQAVRYGWVVKDRNNSKIFILTTSLKNSK